MTQKIKKYYNDLKVAEPEEPDSIGSLGLGQDWNIRQVVWNLCKANIHSQIAATTNAAPGTKAYLGEYQWATTAIIKGLSDEKIAEFQEIASRWNVEGPPTDIKQLYVLQVFPN